MGVHCTKEKFKSDDDKDIDATEEHNEDSVSVEHGQGIVVVNNGSTSASYMEVDETLIEDYGQDVLKLDAGKEAHDQGEPSENDGQRAVPNNSRVHIGGNKKSHILNCSVPEIDGDEVLVDDDAQVAIVDESSGDMQTPRGYRVRNRLFP